MLIKYKRVRLHTIAAGNDGDFVSLGTFPADLVPIDVPSGAARISGPIELAIIGRWRDAAGVVVPGVGSFNLAIIQKAKAEEAAGTEEFPQTSETLAMVGGKPGIIGGVNPHWRFGVRLDTVAGNPGGSTTLEILYLPMVQT